MSIVVNQIILERLDRMEDKIDTILDLLDENGFYDKRKKKFQSVKSEKVKKNETILP